VIHRLFFKIFLWFWLALTLVGVALIVATLTTEPEQEIRRWRAAALDIQAQTAAETFEREGAAALTAYFARAERVTRLRSYLFDRQGTELSGRQPPAGASELAALARTADETLFDTSGVITLAARSAAAPSGSRYVLVSELPRRFVPLPGDRRIPPRLGGRRETFPFLGLLRGDPGARLLRWLAVFLTAGVVCYGLARYLTAPVAKLRAATRRLAAGDLAVRVSPSLGNRRDELAELGRDFDRMAERLDALLASQRRLLGDISHELRSPLARLSVALELARQRAGASAKAELDRIEREAEQLNLLIGQLLTLTRLESGVEGKERTLVELAPLVREIAADADFEARGRKRAVRFSSGEECAVDGTPSLLRSAIENVVRNAVTYTAEDTAVEISLRCDRREKARAVITVRDHGPGVPEEALADLFRPFYRVADARERQTGGVGLGLAITERAVRLHGGTVSAANAPDGGLMVEINLPVAARADK
jgi:signal transduction histidine kinase